MRYYYINNKTTARKAKGKNMSLREFIKMYDNMDGIVVVNDNEYNELACDKAYLILGTRADLFEKEVATFGFYRNMLAVRLK